MQPRCNQTHKEKEELEGVKCGGQHMPRANVFGVSRTMMPRVQHAGLRILGPACNIGALHDPVD